MPMARLPWTLTARRPTRRRALESFLVAIFRGGTSPSLPLSRGPFPLLEGPLTILGQAFPLLGQAFPILEQYLPTLEEPLKPLKDKLSIMIGGVRKMLPDGMGGTLPLALPLVPCSPLALPLPLTLPLSLSLVPALAFSLSLPLALRPFPALALLPARGTAAVTLGDPIVPTFAPAVQTLPIVVLSIALPLAFVWPLPSPLPLSPVTSPLPLHLLPRRLALLLATS